MSRKVVALRELSQGPNEETPAFLFASKGDDLEVICENTPMGRLEVVNLTMAGWPSFYCEHNEVGDKQ